MVGQRFPAGVRLRRPRAADGVDQRRAGARRLAGRRRSALRNVRSAVRVGG